MKAATTSIAVHLNEHPDIFIPDEKELHFFVKEVNWSKGIGWYESFFQNKPQKCLGEASTTYTWHPSFKGVPERIKSILPDTKLIYIIRHPIERAFSHYMHYYLSGSDRRHINEALTVDSAYIIRSLYYKQLEQFLYFFDRKNILIVNFDDISNDIVSVLTKIYEFLNIEQLTPNEVNKRYNITKERPFYPDYFLALKKYLPFYTFATRLFSANFRSRIILSIERTFTGNLTLNDLDMRNYDRIVPIVKDDILTFFEYIDKDVSCLTRFLSEVEMGSYSIE